MYRKISINYLGLVVAAMVILAGKGLYISAAKASTIAEKETGGKTVALRLRRWGGGILAYAVVVLKESSLLIIVVNGRTGEVLFTGSGEAFPIVLKSAPDGGTKNN